MLQEQYGSPKSDRELFSRVIAQTKKYRCQRFRKSAMMTEDLSEYEGELSMEIFANFMHRRFIMAHIVQEAFIFTMVLSFLSKSRPFLGLWQFVSLCHGR